MYLLHIGKNIMVKTEEIIGVFRTDILDNTKEYEEMIKNKQIEDVSMGTPKSFVLMKDKGYLSNISVVTLEKRAKGGNHGEIWT